MRALLVAVTVALLGPAAVGAHVDVTPGLLESGEEVELRIELPQLRPGEPPTAVDVLGAGIRQLSSRADGRRGDETRWRVRVAVVAEPGPIELVLRARFEDGRSVDVRRTATVVPAAPDEGPPTAAIAVAVAGLAGLFGAAVLLRRRAGAA
jgi:hypothetical protein